MYYHCSPTQGLKVLQPHAPTQFDKPSAVYLTTSLPMALFYGIRHFEYTYGYTKTDRIYFEEYFPNALEELYQGRSASLYLCEPTVVETTRIPNEAVSREPVRILEEQRIPDLMDALLEQERQGTLKIIRHHQLSDASKAWIMQAEAEEIRDRGLLHTPNAPMAQWMQHHYPESWALAASESY